MRGVRPLLLVVAVTAVPFGLRALALSPDPGRPRVDVHTYRRPGRPMGGSAVARAQVLGGPAVPAVSASTALAAVPATPAPPPAAPARAAQYCAPSLPSSPADYQAAFDAVRQTDTGWVSADGSVPIDVPDGRTVWMFGDTYVGSPDPTGAIGSGDQLVRNSFVVQTGSCFAPKLGGSVLAPASRIPEPALNESYWPSAGVVDRGVLRVFLWHMQLAESGVATLDFQALDMRVATFSLPDLTLVSVQVLPFPSSAARPYGATAFAAPDGDLYLYGMSGRNVYTARAPLGSLLQPDAWTFASGDPSAPTWTTDPQQAAPLEWRNLPAVPGFLGAGEGPAAQPWVSTYGSGFLATAKLADGLSDDVSIFTAPAPQGPWSYLGQIASRHRGSPPRVRCSDPQPVTRS